ncbi:MipA/OmpV family protein [Aliidiomarina minuta]|uniref:MipA/OmpV family protein n=1 Tax=Aliidiomarina minuta TaxID=880057 RepID=UPI0013005624|nr:MipA/OmpV family protein [Aliidiomarina minuta]
MRTGKIISASFVATALMVGSSAQAQWSLGGAVISTDASYKGLDSDTLVVPLVGYEGERFYFRGIEAGYRLNDSRRNRLSAHVTASPFRFRPRENKDPQLSQLDSRNFSAEAGMSYQMLTRYGEVELRGGLDMRGNGHRFSASYSFPLSRDPRKWQFGPRVGATYISSEYTDYYYGVSAAEAERTGLNEYSSQDAVNPFYGLGGYYRFGDRLSVLGNYRITKISSKISNSPMAEGSRTTTLFVALSYSF